MVVILLVFLIIRSIHFPQLKIVLSSQKRTVVLACIKTASRRLEDSIHVIKSSIRPSSQLPITLLEEDPILAFVQMRC